jgi:hypothetical protein
MMQDSPLKDVTQNDRRKFAMLRTRIMNNAVFLFTGHGKSAVAYKPAHDDKAIFQRADWKRLMETQDVVVSALETCVRNGNAGNPPAVLKRRVIQKLQQLVTHDLMFRELCDSSPYVQLMCNTLSVASRERADDGSSKVLTRSAHESNPTPDDSIDLQHRDSTLTTSVDNTMEESADELNTARSATNKTRSSKRSTPPTPRSGSNISEEDTQSEQSSAVLLHQLDQQTTDDRQTPHCEVTASPTSASQDEIYWNRKIGEYRSEEARLEREHNMARQRLERELEDYKIQQLQYEIAKSGLATRLKKVELQRLLCEIKKKATR